MSVTWLFVPGDRPERFAKATAAGPDEVVIDLEDAVAPDAKESARAAAVEWLATGQAWVRINATGTPWHDDDVAALSGTPGLRGVMVAKAEVPEQLPSGVALVPLVESALGIHNAYALAAASGVQRLAFGAIDFALDIDAAENDRSLLLARATLVLASRVAGLAGPIDGVTVSTTDIDVIGADAERARSLGFAGKLCIHPKQIAPVAAAFRPSDDEIDWARGILAASGGAEGVVRVDGQMVDLPVVRRAERILARVSG